MAKTTAGVFRCPSCKEFISVDADACRFCGVAVNAEEAGELTRRQSELDNAIGNARTIKLMFPPFLMLIPVTCLLMNPFWPVVLTGIFEVMCVRWLTGFRSVRTPQVERLRRYVVVAALLVIVVLVVVLVGFYRLALVLR